MSERNEQGEQEPTGVLTCDWCGGEYGEAEMHVHGDLVVCAECGQRDDLPDLLPGEYSGPA